MENKFSAANIDNFDCDIALVTGDIQRVKLYSDLPIMDFTTVEYNINSCIPHRGLLDKPEGYTNESELNSISNDPYTLVNNIKNIIKNGFSGVILTNSHFVVDAVHIYSKMFNKKTQFFIAEKSFLVEHTNDIDALFKRFATAIDILNDDRYEVFGEEE